MTSEQFNEKYKDNLARGHYGCSLGEGEVVEYLDKEFEELIKLPKFRYYQIKLKFGYGRFYCDGAPENKVDEIEAKITEICNKKGD